MVMTGEVKLDNILLVKDRIVFVDLEDAEVVDSVDAWNTFKEGTISQLCRSYQLLLDDHQYGF